MGFLSKIKKGGSETSPDVVRTRKLMAQPEAKVADMTRRARAPIETIGCDSNKGVEIADKIDVGDYHLHDSKAIGDHRLHDSKAISYNLVKWIRYAKSPNSGLTSPPKHTTTSESCAPQI